MTMILDRVLLICNIIRFEFFYIETISLRSDEIFPIVSSAVYIAAEVIALQSLLRILASAVFAYLRTLPQRNYYQFRRKF